MKFKSRQTSAPILCGSAPLDADLSPTRTYTPGETVLLHLGEPGLHGDLSAVVLHDEGGRLRLRALHSCFSAPSTQVVKRGEEFSVERECVFIVWVD